jgi:FtsZ-interacting cell division protein ZipA
MNFKASGRSALIITAALWMCFAGPMRATESDARASDSTAKTEGTAGAPVALNKFTKHRSKKQAAVSRKSDKVAAKPADAKKADQADAAQDDAASPNIPDSVANANAQFQAGNTPADNALKIAAVQADNALKTARQDDQAQNQAQDQAPNPANASAATAELVSADQLNEVDRSLSDGKPPAATLSLAVAQTPAAARSSDSTWDQTSLIGKIFIAFGGLLTFASAARMFMA